VLILNNWTPSIDSLLDKIRLSCIQLTNRHIKNHLYYKGASAYFEIPTIILSVFSGSFSVGSDIFLNQEYISIITCSISMVITILTSIKLFMKITENSTQEKDLSIKFKTLALELFKILSLPTQDRGTDGIIYLNKIYSVYIKLIENSAIINPLNKKDQLLIIDPRLLISSDDETISISTNNSNDNNPIISNQENEL